MISTPAVSGEPGQAPLLFIDVSGDPRAWWGFSESGSKWLKETFQ